MIAERPRVRNWWRIAALTFLPLFVATAALLVHALLPSQQRSQKGGERKPRSRRSEWCAVGSGDSYLATEKLC
jgi:hypothetical protein